MPIAPLDYTPADPDSYKMTIGEHLEELRRRLIFAIIGFAVAMGVSLYFGKDMLSIFCKPMIDVLLENEVNPMLFISNISDGFMVYIQVSMISAAVMASPWIVWQFWLFVASGLYPQERKTITRYIPLSLGLLIGGLMFVYYLVLPWTLQFLMAFSISIPMPGVASTLAQPSTQSAVVPLQVPKFAGDPVNAPDLSMWFDTSQQRLKIMLAGKVRVVQFLADNLVSPQLQLPEYVDMVMGMLVVFALSFQLPIVIMALARIGILDVETLRGTRKMVYFVMAILASIITPGDVITATVALMVPLCLLFEFGIILAARVPKRTLLDEPL
ncbi:MAG: preprotein translocase subunit TatC [Burkholderiales bacterium]|nr:preprotein translocase subunit TatC [Phycisphaerae bacterium]